MLALVYMQFIPCIRATVKAVGAALGVVVTVEVVLLVVEVVVFTFSRIRAEQKGTKVNK